MSLQRRLAADLLKCGESRVVFNPDSLAEINEAITREDVKVLINRGLIFAKPKRGVSRARAKLLHSQRVKGRRRGQGKRKGSKNARTPKKRSWINKIRPQRRFLHDLKQRGVISNSDFRKLYRLAKAGYFRSQRHLKLYLSKLTGGGKK